jgi:hypothetical protein
MKVQKKTLGFSYRSFAFKANSIFTMFFKNKNLKMPLEARLLSFAFKDNNIILL